MRFSLITICLAAASAVVALPAAVNRDSATDTLVTRDLAGSSAGLQERQINVGGIVIDDSALIGVVSSLLDTLGLKEVGCTLNDSDITVDALTSAGLLNVTIKGRCLLNGTDITVSRARR